jgi:hypothetical protein
MCCLTEDELKAHPALVDFQTAEAPTLVQPQGPFSWAELRPRQAESGCIACEAAKLAVQST